MVYMNIKINFKKILIIISLLILSSFWLISCKNNNQDDKKETTDNTILNSIDPTTNTNEDEKSIVIYFSRTNNTKKIASFIVELTDSFSYELLAKIPYTDDDIKYYTNCRADIEQSDPSIRVEIGSEEIDLTEYSTIYLGYPIWHGDAPKIMYTFVESYDLNGKTIIPFCTSASSPIGSSAINLSKLTGEGNWKSGKRFSQNDDKNAVDSWLKSLK